MELILAIIATAIVLSIAMVIKNHLTKWEEPVMESGRTTGKLVAGKGAYESSDMITVVQQETAKMNSGHKTYGTLC